MPRVVAPVQERSRSRALAKGSSISINVEGRVAYLACEDGGDGKHRFYEEANIHRWVSDRGTSPFTRAQVSLGDIKILELQYDDGDESSSEGEDEGAAGL